MYYTHRVNMEIVTSAERLDLVIYVHFVPVVHDDEAGLLAVSFRCIINSLMVISIQCHSLQVISIQCHSLPQRFHW